MLINHISWEGGVHMLLGGGGEGSPGPIRPSGVPVSSSLSYVISVMDDIAYINFKGVTLMVG